MKTAAIAFALSLLAGADSSAPRLTREVSARWTSTSRMTPAEASLALARHDDGQFIPVRDLFEAQKYLRTDGPISMAPHVLREGFRRRLAGLVESPPESSAILPPLLHWLEWRSTEHGIELRGESVQVAVIDVSPGRVIAVLDHQTIHQEWGLCKDEVCVRQVEGPLRSGEVAYSLVIPRAASVSSPVPRSLARMREPAPRFVIRRPLASVDRTVRLS